MCIINKQDMSVAFEWNVQHVRQVISDRNIKFKKGQLSDDECFSVLDNVIKHHDFNEGINYDVIEFWIYAMYRAKIANGRDARYGYYR